MTNRDADDWRAAGACLTADPELFFPLSASGPAAAQAERACQVCADCRVMQPCLEFAMEHAEVDGIWGGTTPQERSRARRTVPAQRRGSRSPRRRAPRAA